MKIRISLLILILIISQVHSVFALQSTGRKCYSTFSGYFFEGSSDSEIIEKYEWRGINTPYPWLEKVSVEPAEIFAKVLTKQNTFGRGTVGVMSEGEVLGPSTMTLDKEFNIRGVGGISGTWDSTLISTKGKQNTTKAGTYTVKGNGTVIATKGAGSITVKGNGLKGSGAVTFNFNVSADPQTHTVTVEPELPKSYECSHENCEITLPDKHHHRITCSEPLYSDCASVTHHSDPPCNRKYYLCQIFTCPNSGNHKVVGICGHTYRKSDSSNHARHEGSCPASLTLNGQTVNCSADPGGYYKCNHTHQFTSGNGSGSGSGTCIICSGTGCSACQSGGQTTNPSVNPNGNGTPLSNGGQNTTPPSNGGCTTTLVWCNKYYSSYHTQKCRTKVSSAYEHQTTCPGCSVQYWTCNTPSANDDKEKHRLRTCYRSACKQQWRRCAYPPEQIGQSSYYTTSPRCQWQKNTSHAITYCSE